ncbi:unnamed protein product [Caretta caretta]
MGDSYFSHTAYTKEIKTYREAKAWCNAATYWGKCGDGSRSETENPNVQEWATTVEGTIHFGEARIPMLTCCKYLPIHLEVKVIPMSAIIGEDRS